MKGKIGVLLYLLADKLFTSDWTMDIASERLSTIIFYVLFYYKLNAVNKLREWILITERIGIFMLWTLLISHSITG